MQAGGNWLLSRAAHSLGASLRTVTGLNATSCGANVLSCLEDQGPCCSTSSTSWTPTRGMSKVRMVLLEVGDVKGQRSHARNFRKMAADQSPCFIGP